MFACTQGWHAEEGSAWCERSASPGGLPDLQVVLERAGE